ncbi:ATP-dependent Clp protease ATP-binding subunit [Candidatus Berkelbacteria bacterium]|nr:ATP-dependent Clp protease ATP-binding subunit [Candidatus Berkelbacteria bacterium]
MSDQVPSTFGKFSAGAKTVLLAAQRYAEAMQTALGSEHLLMAISVTPDTVAYELLRKVPVTPDQIRIALTHRSPGKAGKRGMTPEAKSIIERAAFQASILGAPAIATEFILWSLVSDAACTAYQLIAHVGVEPKSLRKSLERMVLEQQSREHGPSEIEIFGILGPEYLGLPDGTGPLSDPEPDSELSHVHSHDHDHPHPDQPQPSTRPTAEPSEPDDTPLLDEFTLDLTALAADGKLDPLIGRADELERLTHILGRKRKNNPILIGEPGVGKTAIVEGLAQRLVAKQVPEYLQGMRIVSLELGQLVAGTMYRGQFEERLRRLVAELAASEDLILFVDEIHTLVGAGNAEGSLDAANILKPALAGGRIRVIGATTTAEYQQHLEKDTALERRFQPVMVSEPSLAETRAILAGLAPRYADYHGVTMSEELLSDVVTLADQYLHDRRFPDKAIDLLDEAAAARRSATPAAPPAKRPTRLELERSIKEFRNQKDYELRQGNIERAAHLRNQEVSARLSLQRSTQSVERSATRKLALGSDNLRQVLSRWTGIPVTRLTAADRRSLLTLEARLTERVIGQTKPLTAIAAAIRRSRAGIGRGQRPIGAFLLVGPTGVGKTETARVLAEELFGTTRALLKLDMSEFMERHQVARLLGAPPGYVGYETVSPLLEEIRRRPHQVLLLDEIEKAHPDVMNLLLQILEDGVLTDSQGRTIHFEHTVVLMTSNLGGELWQQQGGLGFRQAGTDTPWWSQPLHDTLRAHFRPELLGRLDGTLIYQPLGTTELRTIAHLRCHELVTQVATQGITLNLGPTVIDHLVTLSAESREGARALRRFVTTELATKVADATLRWPACRHFTVEPDGKSIRVRRQTAQRSPHHDRNATVLAT